MTCIAGLSSSLYNMSSLDAVSVVTRLLYAVPLVSIHMCTPLSSTFSCVLGLLSPYESTAVPQALNRIFF